jgi:hypothetical protein
MGTAIAATAAYQLGASAIEPITLVSLTRRKTPAAMGASAVAATAEHGMVVRTHFLSD